MYSMHSSNDTKNLELYSTDSSIFKVTPKDVVYPKNIQEIQEIVRSATKESCVVSVRAGGTCMCGGSLTSGTMIDMKRFMNSVKILPYSKSADIQMGAYYRDLEAAAKIHNLMFAPYTSSKDICGIGGMIGNNASGEKSIRHGATIDNVHSVTVVLFDGEVYTFDEITERECAQLAQQKTTVGKIYASIRDMYKRYGIAYEKRVGDVKKAASGYRLEHVYNHKTRTWNLAKLFVGSQATLGIVISARLKLVPIPLYTRTIVVPIEELSHLPKILQTIMKYNPEGVETFDVNTWLHAKFFMPDEALHISTYFSHGEKLVVLVQFSEKSQVETDTIAHRCQEALVSLASRSTYVADMKTVESLWAVRRSAFRVLRDAVYDTPKKKAVPCIEDIIVPVAKYDVFIPQLLEILTKHNIEFGFHGHIGDGALRVIPIIDFTDTDKAISQINELCTQVFTLVKELEGNTSADHGDGIIRTPFLREFYGDALYEGAILGIKKLFDPNNIFNNDKKVSIEVRDWKNMLK